MGFVLLLLKGITYLIIGDAVLSWFVPVDRFPRSLTSRLTAPLYAPFHALIPPEKTGGIDLSPIAVLMIIQVITGFVAGARF